MTAPNTAWDQNYKQKGALWRGAPQELPGLPPGSHVLELGCGNGKTLSAMTRRPWHVYALDFAPQAVRLGRKNTGAAEYFIADASAAPFRNSTFDAIFARHITGHTLSADRKNLAYEIERLLKPGGRLYFRDFGTGDMRSGKGEEIEKNTYRRGNGVITHYFTEPELIALFDMLENLTTENRTWNLRIRGRDLPRSEITGVFKKRA